MRDSLNKVVCPFLMWHAYSAHFEKEHVVKIDKACKARLQ